MYIYIYVKRDYIGKIVLEQIYLPQPVHWVIILYFPCCIRRFMYIYIYTTPKTVLRIKIPQKHSFGVLYTRICCCVWLGEWISSGCSKRTSPVPLIGLISFRLLEQLNQLKLQKNINLKKLNKESQFKKNPHCRFYQIYESSPGREKKTTFC